MNMSLLQVKNMSIHQKLIPSASRYIQTFEEPKTCPLLQDYCTGTTINQHVISISSPKRASTPCSCCTDLYNILATETYPRVSQLFLVAYMKRGLETHGASKTSQHRRLAGIQNISHQGYTLQACHLLHLQIM